MVIRVSLYEASSEFDACLALPAKRTLQREKYSRAERRDTAN
jgi:hypothetical protein